MPAQGGHDPVQAAGLPTRAAVLIPYFFFAAMRLAPINRIGAEIAIDE